MLNYTVIGRGRFPMTMLQREQAFPNTAGDAIKVARCFEDQDNEVTITLGTNCKAWELSPESWRSFGWDVVTENVLAYDPQWVAEKRARA